MYKTLRRYMQNKKQLLQKPYRLKDCTLVIDDSFFNSSYKSSGCDFVFGPECDKYANYLINDLQCFIDSNVKIFVILSGCTKIDFKVREKAHQKIIDERNNVGKNVDDVSFFEPTFVKDVQREVLDKLNIKYFYCEQDSSEAIVSVARKFKCFVLSNKIEYCHFGVSVITPYSINFLKDVNEILCDLYEHEKVKSVFGVYHKTPILLTLLNESGVLFNKLTNMIDCDNGNIVVASICWVRSQRKDAIENVLTELSNEIEKKASLDLYNKIKLLYLYSPGTLAVKHFTRQKPYRLFKDDKKWFIKGVGNARIAVPYINLKKSKTISGSHLIFDENESDAMLAAIDIILCSYQLLTNSQKSELTFVGRKMNLCRVWKIASEKKNKISNRLIFTDAKKVKARLNLCPLNELLNQTVPNFNIMMLDLINVPSSSSTLVLTLVYYVCHVNNDFVFGAYCVILSYVMLSPVDETLHANLKHEDYTVISQTLKKYFQKPKPTQKLDHRLLHTLAEFQHCLQHMNYLIKLCNNDLLIHPCTVYHKTYNGTFIYN